MNEKYMEALAQYDLTVDSVRKGRSGWICDTSLGTMLLKEYRGTLKRLEFETQVLGQVAESGLVRVDDYIATAEGSLISLGDDGTRYVLKHWFTDRECNLKEWREILQAVRQIARLHKTLRQIPVSEEWNLGSILVESMDQEMERHNQELKRARNYIKNKKKKTEFERCIMNSFPLFYDQALEAWQGMCQLTGNGGKTGIGKSAGNGSMDGSAGKDSMDGNVGKVSVDGTGETLAAGLQLCHGCPDHHHILLGNSYVAFIEFNKMHLGSQMTDLYHFMRKVMEKQDWNLELGEEMITSYDRILPLAQSDRDFLYYLFLYPEKYWKQINFYYNARKAWIPVRNMEKIQTLENQTESRLRFLGILR